MVLRSQLAAATLSGAINAKLYKKDRWFEKYSHLSLNIGIFTPTEAIKKYKKSDIIMFYYDDKINIVYIICRSHNKHILEMIFGNGSTRIYGDFWINWVTTCLDCECASRSLHDQYHDWITEDTEIHWVINESLLVSSWQDKVLAPI